MKTARGTNPTKSGTTQKFTEIQNIIEDVVILDGGNACLVIKVEAVNFSLLSEQEKNSKIYAYMSLLNSLSFPIQILIKNQRIDLSFYLTYLDQESKKVNPQNSKFLDYIKNYKEFVQKIITVNSVLDKNFYIVIPYSYLETGISGAKNKAFRKEDFASQATTALHTKAASIHSQFSRLSLKAKTLGKEELVKLFYSIFNSQEGAFGEEVYRTPVVTGIAYSK